MNSSDSYWKTDSILNMAIGYVRTEQTHLQPNQPLLPMRGTPTGGSYSTAEDMSRFAIALQTCRLLNADYAHLVTTGKVDTPDGQKYAYGFRDRTENGLHWIGHSGGGPGANTTFRIYPQVRSVVIVLSNLDYPAADRLADFVSRQS